MKKSAQRFKIVVPDYLSSVQEYHQAMRAPKSELPELNDAERDMARRFKISQEEYARGVLAGLYGQERMKRRGERLGDIVQAILDESGNSGRVSGILYQSDRPRWIVTIRAAEGETNIAIPRELADDVVDWALRDQMEDLRARLLRGLGLSPVSASGQE